MRRLLLDFSVGSVRCALFEDGVLAEMRLIRDGDDNPAGSIHRARVKRIFHETRMALLETVSGEAVLRLRKDPFPEEGSLLTIEIARASEWSGHEEKRALAKRIEDWPRSGRSESGKIESGEIACLRPAPDPLTRFDPDHVEANDPAAAPRIHAAFPRASVKISARWHNLFATEGLDTAWDEAASGRVPLAQGFLIVEKTSALWSIDVNTGGQPAKANGQAAERIGRLLRCWNLGGLIVVDFVSPTKRNILSLLDKGFEKDPARPERTGLSPFGTLEIVRTKTGPALPELLTPGFAETDTLLRAALMEGLSARPGALSLFAPPEVMRALELNPILLETLKARTGRNVSLTSSASLSASLT